MVNRDAKQLLGKVLTSSRDWTVTDIADDGTVTLGWYVRFDRTLRVGDFSGPDPTAIRLLAHTTAPIQLIWDAIDCELMELDPYGPTEIAEPVPEPQAAHPE